MDAIKFLQERERLCRAHPSCNRCPLQDLTCNGVLNVNAEPLVDAVEEWSAAHPVKTRQSVFLEQWPEAKIDVNGVVQLCPMAISAAHRDSNGGCGDPEELCRDCRRKFWGQEVE